MADAAHEIRAFAPTDREAIAVMAKDVAEGGAEFVYDTVDGVIGYWLGPDTETFVACIDGRVAGTYAIKPNQADRGAHVANAGYMVGRDFRGRGLGRTLAEHSIAHARARGYRAIQFNFVVATNAAAVHLWERLGFEIVGTLPGAFRHRELGYVDAHVMYLELE